MENRQRELDLGGKPKLLRKWCNRIYLGVLAGLVTIPANVMTQVALDRDIDWAFVAGLSAAVSIVFPLACSAMLTKSRGR